MRFYLGTHRPNWLWSTTVPLFVSHRTLGGVKNLRPATCSWALDSGGFTELSTYGEWVTPPHQYIAAVRRYHDEIGSLDWAAPQDWMCEPFMLDKTRKTVKDHQRLTIESVLALRTYAPDLPIIPVLQGWETGDYLDHVDQYHAAGFDLTQEPTVGLGSVCRRQATGQAEDIVIRLQGIRLHGFGMKTEGVHQYGALLHSADSMAWSYAGRRRPDPTCPKRACNNCRHYALDWRRRLLNPTRPTLFGVTR